MEESSSILYFFGGEEGVVPKTVKQGEGVRCVS